MRNVEKIVILSGILLLFIFNKIQVSHTFIQLKLEFLLKQSRLKTLSPFTRKMTESDVPSAPLVESSFNPFILFVF